MAWAPTSRSRRGVPRRSSLHRADPAGRPRRQCRRARLRGDAPPGAPLDPRRLITTGLVDTFTTPKLLKLIAEGRLTRRRLRDASLPTRRDRGGLRGLCGRGAHERAEGRPDRGSGCRSRSKGGGGTRRLTPAAGAGRDLLGARCGEDTPMSVAADAVDVILRDGEPAAAGADRRRRRVPPGVLQGFSARACTCASTACRTCARSSSSPCWSRTGRAGSAARHARGPRRRGTRRRRRELRAPSRSGRRRGRVRRCGRRSTAWDRHAPARAARPACRRGRGRAVPRRGAAGEPRHADALRARRLRAEGARERRRRGRVRRSRRPSGTR